MAICTDLRDLADAVGLALPEEQALADLDVLGPAEEAEEHGGRLVGAQAGHGGAHALDHGRLAHVAHVHRGAEAGAHQRRVELHAHRRLQEV